MSRKEKFQKLADKLLNDKFSEFKETFIFYNEDKNTQEYDDEVGDYVNSVIPVEAEGTPVKLSKDLLASGIYESGDIEVIFIFNELPEFTDLNTQLLRVKTDTKYTIVDYKPDIADATVRLQLRR